MAMAVHSIGHGRRPRRVVGFLSLTILFGLAFLGIKFFEYFQKFQEHLVPGQSFHLEGAPVHTELFFSFYFVMTAMHALHMIIGISAIGILIGLTLRKRFSPGYYSPIEMVGLYWHFVDIVWVFLFPLLYLVDRS
jgi:cytochrome c oxidase subunit 3